MKNWASQDVVHLFDLKDKQIAWLPSPESRLEFDFAYKKACHETRSMQFSTLVPIKKSNRGKVVGKGGCNISRIEVDSGARVSGHREGFAVFAINKIQQDAAIRMIKAKAK